jgi:hypothetical protein
MRNELYDQVRRSFAAFAGAHGLRVQAEGYSEQDFGNSLVILEGEQYAIRVVRDRRQVFVDLASPADPGDWLGLGSVLAVLHGDPQYEQTWSGSLDLDAVASVLAEHHDRLVESLSRSQYAHTKRALEHLQNR